MQRLPSLNKYIREIHRKTDIDRELAMLEWDRITWNLRIALDEEMKREWAKRPKGVVRHGRILGYCPDD